MTDLTAKFAEFHSSNPRVYELFKRFTFEALHRNHNHLSADMILHRVRWETGVMTHDPDGWKINNNWCAFYSRMFMEEYPQHAGFFRTRTSVADMSDPVFTKELVGVLDHAKGLMDWGIERGHTTPERLRLTVDARREETQALVGAGMSQRQAARVLGVDQKTVCNDLRNHSSESEEKFLAPANGHDRGRHKRDKMRPDPVMDERPTIRAVHAALGALSVTERRYVKDTVLPLYMKGA